MENWLGILIFAVWFLIFVATTIYINTYVLENNKNFIWTFVWAFFYLGVSWVICRLIGII